MIQQFCLTIVIVVFLLCSPCQSLSIISPSSIQEIYSSHLHLVVSLPTSDFVCTSTETEEANERIACYELTGYTLPLKKCWRGAGIYGSYGDEYQEVHHSIIPLPQNSSQSLDSTSPPATTIAVNFEVGCGVWVSDGMVKNYHQSTSSAVNNVRVVGNNNAEECNTLSPGISSKVTIIEALPFFNELPLLLLRLLETSDVTDYYLIIESPLTHTGNPKDLHWLNRTVETVDLFKPYLQKIIPVAVPLHLVNHPNLTVTQREEIQRDYVLDGLLNLQVTKGIELTPTNHLVVVSDADEIVSQRGMLQLAENKDKISLPATFHLSWHFYSMEWLVGRTKWGLIAKEGCVATTLQQIEEKGASRLRRNLRYLTSERLTGSIIDDGSGWHLQSFGGPEAVARKMRETCCEAETYVDGFKNDEERLGRLIRAGVPYYLLGKVNGVDHDHSLGLNGYDVDGENSDLPLGVEKMGRQFWEGFLFASLSDDGTNNYQIDRYMIEQDIFRTMEKNSNSFAMDWWDVDAPSSSSLRGMKKYEVKGICGKVDDKSVKDGVESIIGEIEQQTVDVMRGKFEVLCEGMVDGTEVKVEIVHDETRFIEVNFNGKMYIIKIDPGDDCEALGKYHCDNIGLNEEQCKEVVEMMESKKPSSLR